MYFTLAISAATSEACAARVTLAALLSGDWLNARVPSPVAR
jgi:hypothetical protein